MSQEYNASDLITPMTRCRQCNTPDYVYQMYLWDGPDLICADCAGKISANQVVVVKQAEAENEEQG